MCDWTAFFFPSGRVTSQQGLCMRVCVYVCEWSLFKRAVTSVSVVAFTNMHVCICWCLLWWFCLQCKLHWLFGEYAETKHMEKKILMIMFTCVIYSSGRTLPLYYSVFFHSRQWNRLFVLKWDLCTKKKPNMLKWVKLMVLTEVSLSSDGAGEQSSDGALRWDLRQDPAHTDHGCVGLCVCVVLSVCISYIEQ